MDLTAVRARLDQSDTQLLDLFCERLRLAGDVAAAKAETSKAIFDPAREREKLFGVAKRTPEEYRPQATALFSLLMSLNKAEQQRILAAGKPDSISAQARASLQPVDEPFPATATVRCQGVEGATASAATRLFRTPGITYFGTFEGVCRAVRDGLCQYGVLPIENSTAGSVTQSTTSSPPTASTSCAPSALRSITPARQAGHRPCEHPRGLVTRAGARPVRRLP